ncbi:hypothetical protein OGATHE_006634 [Ogataea polymorpha]|uniref:Uncharacterized protein n=1 Tax=Ogataea polymorpha TaxID=460523 RepID=A0A9P8SX83_9ASCO|nr:hypothetical protein OGATHE_006634 [Ogataea polymorpha]
MPPATKQHPSTRSKFERIEPNIEAWTTVIWFWLKAITLTITSTAFPNVALRSPAIESLWMASPNSSVA